MTRHPTLCFLIALSPAAVAAEPDSNALLKMQSDYFGFEATDQPADGEAPPPGIQESAAALVTSPSAVLVGATDFFVERAEVEVRAWAGDRLAKQICKVDQKCKSVQPGRLAPAICDLGIDELGLDSASGRELVAAARKDGRALPRNVTEEVLRTPKLEDEQRDALISIAVLGRMTELVAEGHSPHLALASWARAMEPTGPDWSCPKRENCSVAAKRLSFDAEPVASALYTASLAAGCVPENAIVLNKGRWETTSLGADQAKQVATCLVEDLTEANLPSGAPQIPLLQSAGAVAGSEPASAEALEAVNDLIAAAEEAQAAFAELKNIFASRRSDGRAPPPSTEQAVAAWASAIASSAELSAAVLEIIDTRDAQKGVQISKWIQAVSATIADGEYLGTLAAISNAPFVGDKVPDELKSAYSLVGKAAGLTTDLAAAESPEQAQFAISRFAAPAGGYKAKRRGPRAIYATVNGYLGAGAGAEFIPAGGQGSTSPAAWPTLQLGPELGFRVGSGKKHPSAIGVQLAILDLGAIAVWRMDGASEQLPELDIRNVFAPSANLMWGLPGAPFSVGLMGGLNPALRKIEEDGSLVDATSGRLGFILAVDMPVLN